MKTALVMGGSGDIGMAVCRLLAEKGWSIYCHCYTNEKKVLSFILEMREAYPQQDFFMVSYDMLSEKDFPAFLHQLLPIDGIVFASGFTKYGLLTEHTPEEIENLWKVHMYAPLRILQSLEADLRRSGEGRVVFIGSVYGLKGSSMETVYSGVKGAQQAFVKAYAKEVATFGITVNLVAPGAVQTRMNEAWTKQEIAELTDEIPVRRLARPEEVAQAAGFLFSKEAGYITGAVLPVTGGWLD